MAERNWSDYVSGAGTEPTAPASADSNPDEEITWEQWNQAGPARAASPQKTAGDDVEAAADWATWGGADASQPSSAQTAHEASSEAAPTSETGTPGPNSQ